LFTQSAEAIEVNRNHRGKVCIYVPKAYILNGGNPNLEVYWGAYTMRLPVSGSQFPDNTTGVNGGLNIAVVLNGSSSDRYSSGRNPNFGLELNAYGNNVTTINTNFPVAGFEQQGCKSDYNLTMY
jgi:hypothetical protein